MEHFGKYQLIRKLATGGMAEVFLAKSAGPMGFEKILVVKRILPHLAEDPAFVQRFLAEAKLAARLDHPNVVTIFDLGEERGEYFIAMEYIDGPSLRSICRRLERNDARLPLAFCAKVISMACEGLAYAHDFRDPETGKWLGIIHRDISPENILLSRTGTVKVVDFGLAKASEVSETRSKILFGKYFYMAPEQLRRRDKLDRRVDVYALGVVLYELLTSGQKPYEASGEVEMMRAILAEQLVPVSKRRRDVPPALEKIVDKALAAREQRYADCMQLQMDLEAFILQTGTPMGTQQISRIMSEMGLASTSSTGQHAPPPAAAPAPEPTRATPSIAAFERENMQFTRATPSTEAAEGAGEFSRDLPDNVVSAEQGVPSFTRATPSTEAAERAGVPLGNETRMLNVEQEPEEEEDPRDQATLLDLSRNGLDTSGSYDATRLNLETSGSYNAVPNPQDATRLMSPGERALPRYDEAAPETPSVELSTGGGQPTVVLSGRDRGAIEVTTSPGRAAANLRSLWPWLTAAGGALLVLIGLAIVILRSTPGARPQPAGDATTEPRTMTAEGPKPAPQLPSQPAQLARVRIATDPPAEVRVNGDLLGRSPVDVVDHEPGEISVEVADKEVGFRKDVRLELAPGDNGTKTISVERLEVQIHVRPKSQLTVDGRLVGEMSNARISLFEGWHKVHLVNRELSRDVVKDFIVLPGQANVFNYDLRH